MRANGDSLRSRSSTALSAASVLKMKARVRSPGSSAPETAAAAVWRSDRSGSWSFESAISSETSEPSSGTFTAEISSPNRRAHDAWLEIDFSARIFSSGSDSRCGR